MKGGALLAAIGRVRAMGNSWPKPPENPVATSHAADSFGEWEAGRNAGTESALALIERMRVLDPTTIHRRDLRRTIHPGWALLDRKDDTNLAWLLRLLDAVISSGRRPLDLAVVSTWLDVFPEGPGSEQLAAAAAMAANRHDWPYAAAGQRFSLWERASAAAALGREMLANADTDAALKSAALRPGHYTAGIVIAGLEAAAIDVAGRTGTSAEIGCAALLDMSDRIGIAGTQRALVVRALLRPWRQSAPPEVLRRRIQRFVVSKVGDPRSREAPWSQLAQQLTNRGFPAEPDDLAMIIRRWLVKDTFDLFFRLVGRTTDDPVQWRRRDAFWRRYLESDLVTNAWFILGDDAKRASRADGGQLDAAGGHGELQSGAMSDQSALLMQIGELTIAEWSSNGSCCFWRPGAERAPVFGSRKFDGVYMRAAEVMKALAYRQAKREGRRLWIALSHNGSWEYKFAEHIRNPHAEKWQWYG